MEQRRRGGCRRPCRLGRGRCDRLSKYQRSASNAYSSGYAAGSEQGYAAGSANAQYAMGAIYATLPSSYAPSTAHGSTYYLCGANGNTWIQPCYGANGVYYRVVPSPY
jgi:hypothetical protein